MSMSARVPMANQHNCTTRSTNTTHTISSDPLEEPPPFPNTYPRHDPTQQPLSPAHQENIDVFLYEQVVFARDGGVHYFLVHWKL
jgi:hypothetical protein